MTVTSLIRRKFLSPLLEFLHDSRAVGIVLIICTLISMIVSNTAWGSAFTGFWTQLFDLQGGHYYEVAGLHLPNSPLQWINDVLMVFFFLLVGMEIKRELTIGELSSVKKSLLPVLAAVGGMVVPALIFTCFNSSSEYAHGWGIPMATDIAFSLGVLSLLGNRVPLSLKIFLTALAIIDDLGAILVIAVFYTDHISIGFLLGGAGILALLVLFNMFKVKRLVFYIIPGIVLWYCIFNSGIHATIAGVLLSFCIPLDKISQLEHRLHDPVNFIVMPLFALANTAIVFPPDILHAFSNTVSYGIIAGLVVGKPVGIFLFSFIATKLKLAALPSGTRWSQLLGIGIIAGIGFTMSIFIASLAYHDASQHAIQVIAIISVITASLLSGILGFVYLRLIRD
ncbi:Na+/H+ antiporter NhaA [uncultured Chitinophaga sp.]|uniref:Na+/H+ antiporter NhaA n=1 Tax=uncultured Chitinophaga sp. TaxID=339340 RepID=UPI0025CFD3BE|nr:Na+/H+ antiporter NhaA [uncultured Chitinophaga sp.]